MDKTLLLMLALAATICILGTGRVYKQFNHEPVNSAGNRAESHGIVQCDTCQVPRR